MIKARDQDPDSVKWYTDRPLGPGSTDHKRVNLS